MLGRIVALSLFLLVACTSVPSPSAPAPLRGIHAPAETVCETVSAAFRDAEGGRNVQESQAAVKAASKNVACLDGGKVPGARGVFQSAARQTVRDLIAARDRNDRDVDWQNACETYAALATGPKTGIGDARSRDLADVLCAYADAASGTAAGYLSALAQVESVRDADLRDEARKDLVTRAYLLYYFLGVDGMSDSGALRETYPLSSVVDPTTFVIDAGLPVLYQTPIPDAFFAEQGIDGRAKHDLVYAHFMREVGRTDQWETVVSMADAYVKRGEDPAFVYPLAYECLMDGATDFTSAIQVAAQHLGPSQVRAAEDGRIRQLDAEARYTIAIGPDGRRSKLYPMRDE